MCATRGDEVLHESLLGLSEKGGPLHSTGLLEEVEAAASAAGGWAAVDRIAVGLGPGSFTGLRIGLATARALGLSCDVPVSGVCTLDALGRGLSEAATSSGLTQVRRPTHRGLAVIDARRGEVFAALYSLAGERLWEPCVVPPDGLAERVAEVEGPLLAAGSGALRFRKELASQGVAVPDDADPVHRIAARHVCALAAAGAEEDGTGPVVPIYLRPPDAERWRERDTSQAAD